nr:malate dehydrogenase, cytoplasmic [Quercus suber]
MGFDGTDVTEGSERLAEAIGDDSEAVICAFGFKPRWDLFAPWNSVGGKKGLGLGLRLSLSKLRRSQSESESYECSEPLSQSQELIIHGECLCKFKCVDDQYKSLFQVPMVPILSMTDTFEAAESLNGIRMEMTNAAFPLLKSVVATTDVVEVCKDVNIAVILGGYPRKKITLRKDMLSTNVFIYKAQALALEEHAADAKTIQITSDNSRRDEHQQKNH